MATLRSPHQAHHKSKLTRLETEIDKCRADSNWSKAVSLAKQITAKSSGLGARLLCMQSFYSVHHIACQHAYVKLYSPPCIAMHCCTLSVMSVHYIQPTHTVYPNK
jgi:hypothetical protein